MAGNLSPLLPFSLLQVASPKLFTKEFNPAEPPVKSKPNNISSIPGTSGVSPLSTGGKAGGGINITPQLIQQLLASASKVFQEVIF